MLVQIPDEQVEQRRAQRTSLQQAYPHTEASRSTLVTLVTLHNARGVLVQVLQ